MSEADDVRALKLHDTNFFGIESDEKRVRLSFSDQSRIISLTLDDVKGIYVSHFLRGNIVFEVNLYFSDDFPFGTTSEREDVIGNYVKYYGDLTNKGEVKMKILLITPSYGAEAIFCFYGDINHSSSDR